MEISNGPNITFPSIGGKKCGNSLPSPIISDNNELHLHFHSDATTTGKGFKIKVLSFGKMSIGTIKLELLVSILDIDCNITIYILHFSFQILQPNFVPTSAKLHQLRLSQQYLPQLHQHQADVVEFPTQIGLVAQGVNLVILEGETVIEILTVLVTLLVAITIAVLTFHCQEATGHQMLIVAKVK